MRTKFWLIPAEPVSVTMVKGLEGFSCQCSIFICCENVNVSDIPLLKHGTLVDSIKSAVKSVGAS